LGVDFRFITGNLPDITRKHIAISVRLSDELHEQLRKAAVANERTVAQETRRLLSLQLERDRDSETERAAA
jgi:hypothetical protein